MLVMDFDTTLVQRQIEEWCQVFNQTLMDPKVFNSTQSSAKQWTTILLKQCLALADDYRESKKVWIDGYVDQELQDVYGAKEEDDMNKSKLDFTRNMITKHHKGRRQVVLAAIAMVGIFAAVSGLFSLPSLFSISSRGASHHTVAVLQDHETRLAVNENR